MSHWGVVLDPGSPDCKHQALAGCCGYEYCMKCSYKFFGHCAQCEKRKQSIMGFLGWKKEKLAEFDKKFGNK